MILRNLKRKLLVISATFYLTSLIRVMPEDATFVSTVGGFLVEAVAEVGGGK